MRIDRPPTLVFDFLADGKNNPRWQPRVLEIEPGADVPAVGVTYRESMSHPLGFRVPADYKLTVFERPTRLVFEVTAGGPLRPTGSFELAPAATAATDVRYTMEYRPRRRILTAPLLPIVGLLLRWETRWLDNAKRVLEAPAA